jgi:hypothetical protein
VVAFDEVEAKRVIEAFYARPVADATSPAAAAPAAAPIEPQAKVKAPKAPKHRTPEWRRIDKRGATWKPRTSGLLSWRDVHGPYSVLPDYFTPAVQAAASGRVLGAYIACVRKADYDGAFDMPAAELGDLIGCSTRNARYPLEALLAARLILVKYRGGQEQATVYTLTPHSAFDPQQAIKALTEARAARWSGAGIARKEQAI